MSVRILHGKKEMAQGNWEIWAERLFGKMCTGKAKSQGELRINEIEPFTRAYVHIALVSCLFSSIVEKPECRNSSTPLPADSPTRWKEGAHFLTVVRTAWQELSAAPEISYSMVTLKAASCGSAYSDFTGLLPANLLPVPRADSKGVHWGRVEKDGKWVWGGKEIKHIYSRGVKRGKKRNSLGSYHVPGELTPSPPGKLKKSLFDKCRKWDLG